MVKSKDVLSIDEFNRLIDAVPDITYFEKDTPPHIVPKDVQIILKLMFYCGLKIADVERLKPNDFRFEKKEINTVYYGKHKPATIPPIIFAELQKYIKQQPSNKKILKRSRQNTWLYAKMAGQIAKLNVLKLQKVKQVEGVYTHIFRESLKQIMRTRGATEDQVSTKFRQIEDSKYTETRIEQLKLWEEENFPRPKLTPQEINENIQWYRNKRKFYEVLEVTAFNTISDILKKMGFSDVQVISRTKEVTSFKTKLEDGFPYNPKQMQDLVGVRIICKTKSEVEKILDIIQKNFIINKKLSRDKFSEILGEDKVGYKSNHVVVQFTEQRINLPEWSDYKNMLFEIQVRTILQHAWAEIAHERNYKQKIKKLPDNIKRDLNLLAGTLELIDNHFEEIIKKTEK